LISRCTHQSTKQDNMTPTVRGCRRGVELNGNFFLPRGEMKNHAIKAM
jgi:hypothetical protein